MSKVARRPASHEDFLSIPESQRFHELIDGEIVERSAPSAEHGDAQAGLVAAIRPSYQRQSGGRGGPGGWWILTEVEVALGSQIVRPDVTGWRRVRCQQRPSGTPILLRPDWICEVVSECNANQDTVKKLRLYHQQEIPHYWIVDPRDETLTVLRWSADGFVNVLRAERGEVVRAEPFDGIDLRIGSLFGDDPPEPDGDS